MVRRLMLLMVGGLLGMAPLMLGLRAKPGPQDHVPRLVPVTLPGSARPDLAPDHGAMWRDIRDFGAIPGEANAVATRKAIQAAIDSLDPSVIPLRTYGVWGTVYIPTTADAWYIDRPVFLDQNRIEFRGDGQSSFIRNVSRNGSTCLFLGMPRKPMGVALSPDHIVDLFGKLDASAAPAAGQRWGYRVKQSVHGLYPESNLTQGAGPFVVGWKEPGQPLGYWADIDRFTIEFATDWTGNLPHFGAYFGMTDQWSPRPWYIVGGNDGVGVYDGMYLYFRTQDGSYDGGSMGGPIWRVAFPSGNVAAMRRFAVQLDLTTATAQAFVDGVQVPTTITPGLKPGAKLTSSQNYTFKLGAFDEIANGLRSPYYTYLGTAERSFAGLRISKGLRYANDGIGRPQRRADGGLVNDATRYFEYDRQTIAMLPMQDEPADVVASRLVKVWGPVDSYSHALFTSEEHATPFSALAQCNIRDVRIEGYTPAPYGEAVTVGFGLHANIQDATLRGGCHGIGCWNWGANYVTRLRNVVLSGPDAAIYNHFGIMEADGLMVDRHGRSTFWFSTGATFRGRNIFTPGEAAGVEHVVRGVKGCFLTFDGLMVDFEDSGPSVSTFYSENGPNYPLGASLTLTRPVIGTAADKTPLVILHETTQNQWPATVRIDDPILQAQPYRSLVQTDGSKWKGSVRLGFVPTCPVIESRAATASQVTMEGETAPPVTPMTLAPAGP